MLDKIIKYGLYLLAFIFPLFFLPQTISSTAAGKQILLSAFCFLILILWLIKIISSGKLSFVWNKLSLAVLLFISALGISTAFSTAKIQSFWGMNFEPDTFFSFILYGLVFFLFANLIKEKELKAVLISFLMGSGVLALLFLFQVVNPIGTAQGLAVFLGSAFLILMSVLNDVGLQKLFKILGGILGLIFFAAIFLINYWVVWLGIAFGMAIIIFNKLKKLSTAVSSKQANPLKPLFLPLCIFVLALIFIFLKVPTGNLINVPAEISPTYQATFDISTNTLQEGTKSMIFGSGPSTFGYQYNLYQIGGLNSTNFWQLRFNQGTAVLPTLLTTSGISGILALLFLIIIFFFQGLKFLRVGEVKPSQLAALIGSAYFLISWFLYPANSCLMFAAFLMLGLFTVSSPRTKEFLFTKSPQKAFMIMLLGVFMIAGSVFGLYTVSQKYAGEVIFNQGLSLINNDEPKLDEGIVKIYKAIELDPKDSYFRNLSQAFLFKMGKVANNQELEQEQKQVLFQQAVSNAEASINQAITLNPKNSQNWLQSGNIYENFASFGIEGTGEMAVSNYQKARELDPQNPQIPLFIGRTYKSTAERNEDEEVKNQNLDSALEQFQKSIELKNNFSGAYYLTAQVYELKEDKEKALENYQIVLQLEPENEEIQKKIEELSK